MKTFTATLRLGLGLSTLCALLGLALRGAGQPVPALAAAYYGVAAMGVTAALAVVQILAESRGRRSPKVPR